MADFDPPFGASGEYRMPESSEQEQGFQCGPADMALFIGLFNRIESELGHLIKFAGLDPTNADMTQVRKAIQALISTATGGGDTSAFLTLAQARQRLPIMPHTEGTVGHLGVIAPATGTIRIPAGTTFLHRGIFPVTTVQTDFTTVASKTYHLRWDPTNGFRLRDLADAAYNAGTLAETVPFFDTSYDDVLWARVITNSSNVATITNLINKDRYVTWLQDTKVPNVSLGTNGSRASFSFTYNLARTPVVSPCMTNFSTAPAGTGDGGAGFSMYDVHDHDTSITQTELTRYGAKYNAMRDYAWTIGLGLNVQML